MRAVDRMWRTKPPLPPLPTQMMHANDNRRSPQAYIASSHGTQSLKYVQLAYQCSMWPWPRQREPHWVYVRLRYESKEHHCISAKKVYISAQYELVSPSHACCCCCCSIYSMHARHRYIHINGIFMHKCMHVINNWNNVIEYTHTHMYTFMYISIDRSKEI